MKLEAKGWRHNAETGCIEILANIDFVSGNISNIVATEELVIEVPETKFGEIVDTLPSLEEAKEIEKLLRKLYEIKEKQLMEISKADEKLSNLETKIEEVRAKMPKVNDKLALLILKSEAEILLKEKTLIDTKRHLIRMLAIIEGDLRAKLAKIRTGTGRGIDR